MSALVPTICAACAELLVSPAITEPHEHMVPQRQPAALDPDKTKRFRCLECESIWQLHYTLGNITRAQLIDHKGTRTSQLLAACPQPYHNMMRSSPCRALLWSGENNKLM